jgi:hypothetical protein
MLEIMVLLLVHPCLQLNGILSGIEFFSGKAAITKDLLGGSVLFRSISMGGE